MIGQILDFDAQRDGRGWNETAREICDEHGLRHPDLKLLASSDHVVFSAGDDLILKIYRPARDCFAREGKALKFVSAKTNLATPEIIFTGSHRGLDYFVMTRVPGEPLTRAMYLDLPSRQQGEIVAKLAGALREMHSLGADILSDDWPQTIEERASTLIERQVTHGVNARIIAELPAFLDANLRLVPRGPTCFLHGDVHFGNLHFNGSELVGLFDFADSLRGHPEYDFLAVGVLMLQGERELQREFFLAYGYQEGDLDEEMRRRMMTLTTLYETADLRRYAMRLRPDAVELSLEELERAIWKFC